MRRHHQSTNFPATAGAYRTTCAGRHRRVRGPHQRRWPHRWKRATYVGTPGYDQAYFLQLDADGDAYLLGQTLGQFPTHAGPLRHAPAARSSFKS